MVFLQSVVDELQAHTKLTGEPTASWSRLMRQTMIALKYFHPVLEGIQEGQGQLLDISPPLMTIDVLPLSSTSLYDFYFNPNHILGYRPFDAYDPQDPNDPTSQPIDYCIYLHPTKKPYMEAQPQFVYRGSNLSPIESIKYPEHVLPSLTMVGQWDSLAVQFLAHIVQAWKISL